MTTRNHPTMASIWADGPCELHNYRACATCFHLEGCCDWGGCERPEKVTVVFRNGDKITETRGMCAGHARQSIGVYAFCDREVEIIG